MTVTPPGRTPHVARRRRRTLITGGAGFVGCNLAERLAQQGRDVLIFDNLSRPGVDENLAWLRQLYPDRIDVSIADLRDAAAVREAVRDVDQVFHFGAQVAVTSSIGDPLADFEVNARGTLNVLEAMRAQAAPPPLLFASTNKVYGRLDGLALRENKRRYVPADPTIRRRGIAEGQRLDFYSPYGCSKGAADQYVLDYARIYNLPAIVLRMSCLYGPRQFGTEDQGWVAHFLISALSGRPITIYGNGRQVRDLLFVDDAIAAFLLAQAEMPRLRGQVFNLGGGPANAVSLLEILQLIGRLAGAPPEIRFGHWRPGDQAYYVSDARKFSSLVGWQPNVDAETGIRRLHAWLKPRIEAAQAEAQPVMVGA